MKARSERLRAKNMGQFSASGCTGALREFARCFGARGVQETNVNFLVFFARRFCSVAHMCWGAPECLRDRRMMGKYSPTPCWGKLR